MDLKCNNAITEFLSHVYGEGAERHAEVEEVSTSQTSRVYSQSRLHNALISVSRGGGGSAKSIKNYREGAEHPLQFF